MIFRSRSLRFGDFAQMDRVHKVADNEYLPVDIAFFQDGKVWSSTVNFMFKTVIQE